ncbi:hypothetical protein CEY12_09080 [Chryseobacterium sp. T16E-39]|uniref:RDD family protein n=1 Tax=Chryseobacterium sp. T16E-39 TaxID=2015076 RepID=UPI000B5B2489|nr:RDD family protein [Chryseobacterium sp. T16E-39]ASK30258.1 hypothetical protein CEY12_09080 [Chryseobacterium sp. T16E-39]
MENNLFLSKFWSRIWALLIDSLILGIFGFILGFIFKNFFISLGESAKLIGWAISLIYFSVLNSSINKGQTFGKKMMSIQVVDIKGNFISLKSSFIRALVLTAPFFLNGFKIPGATAFSVVTIIQGIIIFSLGIGITIFYIFNKETRQSLHDLAVKTYVVQEYRNNTVTIMPHVKKLSFYLTGGLFLIVILTSIYSANNNSNITKLTPVYEKLLKQNNISDPVVSWSQTTLLGSSKPQSIIYTVSFRADQKLEDNKNNPQIKQAAKIFIDSNAYESDNSILNVVINSGFDIGIARQTYSYNVYMPIYKWREQINN